MIEQDSQFHSLIIGKRQILIALGLLVVFLVIAVSLFFSTPSIKVVTYHSKIPRVEIVEVQTSSINLPLIFRGVLEPKHQLALQASVAGQIISLGENFVSGGHFKKGELLFRLDDHRLKMELAQSLARYEQVRLEELQLIARFESYNKSSGKESLSLLAKGDPQKSAAAAATMAAKAAFEFAQSQLKKARVIAPFDGRVKRQQRHLYEYVAQGTVIANVYADNQYILRLPVTESQRRLLPSLTAKTKAVRDALVAQVYNPEFPSKQYSAKIKAYEGYVSNKNRLSHIVVEMNTAHIDAFPGSLFEVALKSKKFDAVAVLDKSWLRSHDQVWLINENAELEIRQVNVLFRDKDSVYISQGLSAGDKIVSSHLSFVSNGMSVNVAAD